MAPAAGNAPRSADGESAVLPLHHAGVGLKWRSAKDSNLGHLEGCCCFRDSFLDQPDALRFEMAPPLGIAPSSHRLTGGPHTLCVERNVLRGIAHRKPQSAHRMAARAAIAPGRNCTCVVPFRRRMPMVYSATGAGLEMEVISNQCGGGNQCTARRGPTTDH